MPLIDYWDAARLLYAPFEVGRRRRRRRRCCVRGCRPRGAAAGACSGTRSLAGAGSGLAAD